MLAITAQLLLSSVAWIWAAVASLTVYHTPLTLRFLVLSVIASDLPYMALLVSLLRSPGRRTFAYSLAIPAVLSASILLAGSTAVFYIARLGHVSGLGSVTSLVVLGLHFAVLYFAWRAIQQIGIHPDPANLIRASFLTIGYYALVPILLAFGRIHS